MALYVLTSDTVKAEELGRYIAQDWRGVPGLRAGWSVLFGPVTCVLFLQAWPEGGEPPAPPEVPPGFRLERRERQFLRALSPHRTAPRDSAVLELRTYDVRPGQGARFLPLKLENLPLRQSYSPNFGVFLSLSGRQEQVLHLWGYRSLDERAEVRARLREDAQWNAYTAAILPMLQNLTSTILTPLPHCEASSYTKGH